MLAYGTNEANDGGLTPDEYRVTLRKVLTRMRAVLPDAACVLIGPSDRARKVSGATYAIWEPTAWVAAVQREVGPEFGCATWDLQEVGGGPLSALAASLVYRAGRPVGESLPARQGCVSMRELDEENHGPGDDRDDEDGATEEIGAEPAGEAGAEK